ncbi:MAG: UDP-N-acetylmuramate dehydrogenase [Methyloligellaceae bacterium]
MSFKALSSDLLRHMPDLRGKVQDNFSLDRITWFRVGGPAQLLFQPADEADLAYFLSSLPGDVPVLPIGLGSNLLVRDGGIEGVVIRLGRGFNDITTLSETEIRAGTAAPDVRVAGAAAEAGISGLSFYRGIPGSIGGALKMNAGAHGTETCEILKSCRAVNRKGEIIELGVDELGYSYRHSNVPDDLIFTSALYHGAQGDPARIRQEMQEVADYRETVQPVKSRTGGSTFKNPPGESAWKLIDQAGCRGINVGRARVSELHCNFLINEGDARADDLENLGEHVRKRVRENSGVLLEWEIKRLGIAENGPGGRRVHAE